MTTQQVPMPGLHPCPMQNHREGSGGRVGWWWESPQSYTHPLAVLTACLLQELIYKEFFSQGDLVGSTRAWRRVEFG